MWYYVGMQERRIRGLLAAAAVKHSERLDAMRRRRAEQRNAEERWRQIQEESNKGVRACACACGWLGGRLGSACACACVLPGGGVVRSAQHNACQRARLVSACSGCRALSKRHPWASRRLCPCLVSSRCLAPHAGPTLTTTTTS